MTDINAAGCTLNWTAPADDGGCKITSYVIEARESKRSFWHEIESIDSTETKFVVKDLDEDSTYHFRVTARNSIGKGEPLATETAVHIRRTTGEPDPPTPFTVSDLKFDNVTLEWKAPKWVGGDMLLGYLIEMKLNDDGDWGKVADLDKYSKSYKACDLKEGREYYFRISAYNSLGISTSVELNKPIIPKKKLAIPMAPIGPIKKDVSTRESITISWEAPKEDGGAPINRYIISMREANKSHWSRAGTVNSDEYSFQARNLIENSFYHFRIVAENFVGQGDHLQTHEPLQAKSGFQVPSVPEGPLVVSDLTSDHVEIAWKKSTNDGGSAITNYLIRRRDVERPVWIKCGTVSANTFNYRVKDLIEGTEYIVQVLAENAEGLSDPLSCQQPIKPHKTFMVPAYPMNFECISVNQTEISLQWESPYHDGGSPVTAYMLEMCESVSNKVWKPVGVNIDSLHTGYTVTNLKEGNKYLFRISAINSIGQGEPITMATPIKTKKSIVAPSSPIGPLRVTNLSDQSVSVAWTESTKTGGAPLQAYVIEIRDASKMEWFEVDKVNYVKTDCEISNLTKHGQYFIRVRCLNEAGIYSHPLETEHAVVVKSPYTVPGIVRGLKVHEVVDDGNNNTVRIEFEKPEGDGGVPIRWYSIEKRDSQRFSWSFVAKIKPPKDDEDVHKPISYDITELVHGTTYYFRVTAENAEGQSMPCETETPVGLKIKAEIPSKPLEVDAKSSTSRQGNCIELEWKPPLWNGNEVIRSYLVEEWTSETKEWTQIAETSTTMTSHKINGLVENLAYKYRIKAVNRMGPSEASLETIECLFKKVQTVSDPPGGPLTHVLADDSGTIDLSWHAPRSTGGSKINRYVVERLEHQPGSNKYAKDNWLRVATTSDASIRLEQYLMANTRYKYRIVAENDVGRSGALEQDDYLTFHSQHAQVQQATSMNIHICMDNTDASFTSFRLSGLTTVNAYERYIVEKRDDTESAWSRVAETVDGLFRISNCMNVTGYYSYSLRLIPVDANGHMHTPINGIIVNELPSMPLSLTVDEVTETDVCISWLLPRHSGSSTIAGYKIFKQTKATSDWDRVADTPRYKVSCTITDLDPKKECKFKVCAYTDIGIGPGAETQFVKLRKHRGMISHQTD